MFDLSGLILHLLLEIGKRVLRSYPDFSDLADPPDLALAGSESLLEMACRLEMEGEWDLAMGLYKRVAERSPGDRNAAYAQNCIERIQEKKALASRSTS